MPVGKARLQRFGSLAARTGYSCGLAVLLFICGSTALQNAIAEGETRTITLHHIHTDEDITITYKRDGQYDEAALAKLNWFLRDWRRGEATQMDPRLIDLVWEVQRETDAKGPVQVVCGYRSPQTNAMLRHRSHGVARYSMHMLGRAMDFFIPGVPLEELRVIGLRLARGGVGFYPESGSPFVHMDTGNIRMWPRMSREELSRVFPDGKTVLIPTDGRPLPGYALALADIRQRGNDPSENSIDAARTAGINVGDVASNERRHTNPFARLLGLAKDDNNDADEEDADTTASDAAPKPTLIAVIERKTEAATAAAGRAAKAAEAKLIHTAALVHITRVAAAQPPAPPAAAGAAEPTSSQTPSQTPSQVISARGFWQSPPSASAAPDGGSSADASANDALAKALSRHETDLASANADGDLTGAVSPSWPDARDDRVPPELALSYAEQPGDAASPAPKSAATASPHVSVALTGQPAPQSGITIVVKRAANQAASTILTAPAKLASVVKAGARFDDPWLRAMVLSPSVRRFLTTMALGAQDFRSLAALMYKPATSVMMTFAADPNPGLTHDRFSGAAIVFVSTVTYPTHTASLQ